MNSISQIASSSVGITSDLVTLSVDADTLALLSTAIEKDSESACAIMIASASDDVVG